jgi:3-dehydro-4-phosphotetronate decarboxylase
MSDAADREALCRLGQSLYDRGLTHGSTGNISVKVSNGWLMTPTGSNLGQLDPAKLSLVNFNGQHVSGDKPTKESFLHLAMYQERQQTGAIVHLHAGHSVAVSLLSEINPHDVLPPLTAYYVMRIGSLPLVPYYAPGDMQLAEAVRGYAGKHHALLLANHGPIVGGSTLSAAADAIEELEATAKLYLMLGKNPIRPLTQEQCDDIRRRYPIQ